jgi:hypothetical protein
MKYAENYKIGTTFRNFKGLTAKVVNDNDMTEVFLIMGKETICYKRVIEDNFEKTKNKRIVEV